ncbi:MAG: hypothetical protein JXA18_06425 [Chitinispirillaceae bacterium]|nr:hypothetical protein [Chitinispirillaceae bacterium]
MKNSNGLFAALAAASLFGALRCSAPVQVVDGGASGTDVGICMVYGEVIDSLSRPVAESTVRLRPFDYIAGRDTDSVVKRDVSTGADGRFALENVPEGRYIVECIYADSFGEATECVIDSIDTIAFLPPAVLRPIALIVGNTAGEKPLGEGDHSVQVVGLERSTPIDSSGNFRLLAPAGWRRLNLHGIDPDRPDIETLIYLKPGSNELEKQPHRAPPMCDNLDCELAVVRELLDSNDIQSIPPESLVTIEENRVVELRIRGLGMRVLPESVCRIVRLRVLDIGANSLRELPWSLDRLRRLAELVADSNALREVPASIGMIDSLRRLDLSFNQLLSLPEPITYLSLTSLNLTGNMLCNLGEFTRKWIDTYDPDWKEGQNCR